MKYRLYVVITTLFFSTAIFAQSSHFNSNGSWSMNKKELILLGGVSQFLGDLGGSPLIGSHYSLKDLNVASTHYNIGVGFRYRFHKHFATTTMLENSMLKGSDALTKEPVRNARNLSFRSPFLNLSQRIEWIIYSKEEIGSRYGMKGGAKNSNFRIYLFGGVGLAWFNPQAKYNGKYVNLRPLHTEGQGLPDGPKQYLPITLTIPAGLGVRWGISKMWTMGIEATYLTTFSDYIDDVSGKYYDPKILADKFGEASAYLSNPSPTPKLFNPGSIRGKSKDKDVVLYLNLTFTRNLTFKNYGNKYRVRKYKYQRSKF